MTWPGAGCWNRGIVLQGTEMEWGPTGTVTDNGGVGKMEEDDDGKALML